MTQQLQDITRYKSGDSLILKCQVWDQPDGTGAVVNLTGATITYVLVPAFGGAAIITKTVGQGISIIDATGGIFYVYIEPNDTAALAGDYHHEAEVVDMLGNKYTVFEGTFSILADLVA